MKRNIILTSLLLFVFSSLITAQPFKGNREFCNFNKGSQLLNQLNLTEEQENKIEDLRFEHQNKMIDLRSQLQKNRLEMNKIIKSGDINKSDYLALVNKNNELKAKISTSRAEMFLNIYSLLDEKQKENFTETVGCARFGIKNDFGRMEKRGGGRGNRGMGNF